MRGAGRRSTFLRFGNDGGRGKRLGFSEKFESSTQGSPSPLRDFPGFSKSGQDTPPFQEKLGCRNQCPALARGPGKREAEAGEAADVPSSILAPVQEIIYSIGGKFLINLLVEAGDGSGQRIQRIQHRQGGMGAMS